MLLIKYLILPNKLSKISLFYKFQLVKIKGFIKILFKRKKKIEKITFDYYKNWHFEDAYLVVDFKFKNVIWIRIGKKKVFDFSAPIIFNLENINTETILFEVFGFFQKKVFEINLNKVAKFNRQQFKTRIDNIYTFELLQQKTSFKKKQIGFQISNPEVNQKKISLVSQNIQLNFKSLKIQNYI